jgi:hypothetical protein
MIWVTLIILAILAVALANRLRSVSIVFGDDEPQLREPEPRKQLTQRKARKQLTK